MVILFLEQRLLRRAFSSSKRKIARVFNRKVKTNKIRVGDLVLKQARVVPFYPRGKTNWEGPYYVQKMIPRGAVKLADWDGNEFVEPEIK